MKLKQIEKISKKLILKLRVCSVKKQAVTILQAMVTVGLVQCACNMALATILDTHHLSTASTGGPPLVRHAVNGQEAWQSGVGHWRGWRKTCAERIRMILRVGTNDRTTSKMI